MSEIFDIIKEECDTENEFLQFLKNADGFFLERMAQAYFHEEHHLHDEEPDWFMNVDESFNRGQIDGFEMALLYITDTLKELSKNPTPNV